MCLLLFWTLILLLVMIDKLHRLDLIFYLSNQLLGNSSCTIIMLTSSLLYRQNFVGFNSLSSCIYGLYAYATQACSQIERTWGMLSAD